MIRDRRAVASGVFTSAQAATPTYTTTTGSTGSYGYADDTPAYPYIDSDGKCYSQSSHSLYGATNGRAWQFWNGTNIDTGVTKAAISTATANADTTARFRRRVLPCGPLRRRRRLSADVSRLRRGSRGSRDAC